MGCGLHCGLPAGSGLAAREIPNGQMERLFSFRKHTKKSQAAIKFLNQQRSDLGILDLASLSGMEGIRSRLRRKGWGGNDKAWQTEEGHRQVYMSGWVPARTHGNGAVCHRCAVQWMLRKKLRGFRLSPPFPWMYGGKNERGQPLPCCGQSRTLHLVGCLGSESES